MEVYEFVSYRKGQPKVLGYFLADENSHAIILNAASEEELGKRIIQYIKGENSGKIMNIQNMRGEKLGFPSSYRLHVDGFSLRRGLSMAQLEKVLIAASTDSQF